MKFPPKTWNYKFDSNIPIWCGCEPFVLHVSNSINRWRKIKAHLDTQTSTKDSVNLFFVLCYSRRDVPIPRSNFGQGKRSLRTQQNNDTHLIKERRSALKQLQGVTLWPSLCKNQHSGNLPSDYVSKMITQKSSQRSPLTNELKNWIPLVCSQVHKML